MQETGGSREGVQGIWGSREGVQVTGGVGEGVQGAGGARGSGVGDNVCMRERTEGGRQGDKVSVHHALQHKPRVHKHINT